jgi:hypothetical protein
MGRLALCKGEGEGEGYLEQAARVTVDPSPQSSPLPKGRGGITRTEIKLAGFLSLGSPLPPNSRRFAHEMRISNYFCRIL